MMQSAVREESFNSVRVFWLDYDLIWERLQDRIGLLKSHPEIRKVIIFGSFPEKRAVPGSDLDLLIIVNPTDLPILDRIEHYQPLFEGIGIGVDIFPLTEDELHMPIAQKALSDGFLLFER
ncbi:nucleotidyltransferase domain-containing protein [Methanocalculus taiwanensis]|nr:nucleotidyltransferase domain-containing protein [Methanocalculus taiwanensis]